MWARLQMQLRPLVGVLAFAGLFVLASCADGKSSVPELRADAPEPSPSAGRFTVRPVADIGCEGEDAGEREFATSSQIGSRLCFTTGAPFISLDDVVAADAVHCEGRSTCLRVLVENASISKLDGIARLDDAGSYAVVWGGEIIELGMASHWESDRVLEIGWYDDAAWVRGVAREINREVGSTAHA